MLDMQTISTLVGTIGGPLVMCFLMMKFMKDESDKHDEEVKNLTSSHSADLKEVTTEIHKNNVEVITKLGDVAVALTRLCDSIEKNNK